MSLCARVNTCMRERMRVLVCAQMRACTHAGDHACVHVSINDLWITCNVRVCTQYICAYTGRKRESERGWERLRRGGGEAGSWGRAEKEKDRDTERKKDRNNESGGGRQRE